MLQSSPCHLAAFFASAALGEAIFLAFLFDFIMVDDSL
jgi:hypothetical protein